MKFLSFTSFFLAGTIFLSGGLSGSGFETTRLSLPSEGLSLQSFDEYPEKKGKWYTEDISEGRFGPDHRAAFRTRKGLLIQGRSTGPEPTIRIPLHPKGLETRLTHLREHRLRFMIRANRRGAVRVVMKNSERVQARLNWLPFSGSSENELKEKNSLPFITQEWAVNWQHLEMPVFRQGVELNGNSAPISWDEKWLPVALEFRFSSDQGPLELHLDEVMMDTGTMVPPLNRGIDKSPFQNLWPNSKHPVPGWSYFPWEGWTFERGPMGKSGLHQFAPILGGGMEIIFKEEEGSEETTMIFKPSSPIRIGTDKGVRRVHMSLTSSGISGYRIRLTLREEKVREAMKSSEQLFKRHEHFITHLPLDFRGRRGFDLPLNYVGFPSREDHRTHNKKVDGYLELVSIEVVRSGLRLQDVGTRHRIVLHPVKQWMDSELWKESFPQRRPGEGESVSLPNRLKKRERGVVLRDMESICWNTRVLKGKDTSLPILSQAERSSFTGDYGLQVILPRKDLAKKGDVETTFFFNQTKLSPHDRHGLGEHQLEIRLRATHRGRIRIMLKDDDGQIWTSPFETFRETEKMEEDVPEPHQIISFLEFKGKARNYRNEKGGRGYLAKLPLKLYGMNMVLADVKEEGRIELDDLTLFGPDSRETLRPFGLKRWHLSPIQEMISGNLYASPWFSSGDGWYPNLPKKEDQEMQKKRDAVKVSYHLALKKYEQLRELDRDSKKSLSEFFDEESRLPQRVEGPTVHGAVVDEESITLDIEWLNQKEPPKWLTWGSQSFSLGRMMPQGWLGRVLPLNRGIVGLQLEWENSGFPGTFFEMVLLDDEKKTYRFEMCLEQEGAFTQGLGFTPSYFEIFLPNEELAFPPWPSGNLRLKDVIIGLRANKEGVSGRQSLKLRVPKMVVDREAENSLFPR